MRVAVLFDHFGPYHRARLRAAARQVELLALEFGGHSAEYPWEASSAAVPFSHATLFPDQTSQGFSWRQFDRAMGARLSGFAPQVVAIPGWSGRGAFAAMRWCLRAKVPAVVMSESTAHDAARTVLGEWVKRRYLRLCSAGLTGGTRHAGYLVDLGMPEERITLGYDAVDNAYFTCKAESIREIGAPCPPQRSTFNTQIPSTYFLASARFIEKKNLHRLIDAYGRYRQLASGGTPVPGVAVEKPWNLVLLGDGPLRKTLHSQLSTLHLHDHVEMPGFIQYPELPNYYAKAGAFVHASTTEQWGLVVNEAMASGLPVLVSNRCGCAPDLVREGVNGWTFGPENVEQLAQLMLTVSAKGFPLAELAAASRRIIADWGPERFAAGLRRAAEVAIEVGPKRAGWLDGLLLTALLRR